MSVTLLHYFECAGMFIINPRQILSYHMKCLLIFHVSVEGLPTEDTKNILEKVLSECKNVSQHLEDLARKIQLQEDINAYFKQLNELEKTVKATEERVKHTPFSESPQRALPSLKDSCQVKGHERILCPFLYLKRCYFYHGR